MLPPCCRHMNRRSRSCQMADLKSTFRKRRRNKPGSEILNLPTTGLFRRFPRTCLMDSGRDPLWLAVTGYYGAFSCAKALLVATGLVTRRIEIPGIPNALMMVDSQVSPYPGRVMLRGTKMAGEPHRQSWKCLRALFAKLLQAEKPHTQEFTLLNAVDSAVYAPQWLSDFRNQIIIRLMCRQKWIHCGLRNSGG